MALNEQLLDLLDELEEQQHKADKSGSHTESSIYADVMRRIRGILTDYAHSLSEAVKTIDKRTGR